MQYKNVAPIDFAMQQNCRRNRLTNQLIYRVLNEEAKALDSINSRALNEEAKALDINR
jgi:hypothetical protein